MARRQRTKTLLDFRKLRRSQVFRGHRLRHFLATDDQIRLRFRAICQHLDLIDGYLDEQKLTALLLIMIGSGGGIDADSGGEVPQIVDFIHTELATELIHHMNDELNGLVTGICYIVNEIDVVNYRAETTTTTTVHGIGAHFNHNNLAIRLNVNSISDLMVELLSFLLRNVCMRCCADKLPITNDMLYLLQFSYQQFGQNWAATARNFDNLLTMTEGPGRFQRTKTIAEYEPLMQCLISKQFIDKVVAPAHATLYVLKILNRLTDGFPENIEHLVRLNLVGYLKNQLISPPASAAVIEQCLRILDNMCGNHRSDIQTVIDADLIAPIINGNLHANTSIDDGWDANFNKCDGVNLIIVVR